MGKEAQLILREALEKSNSEVVIFFVVMGIILVTFLLPFFIVMMKDRKERRDSEARREKEESTMQMERERNIIQVVTANTEVMTKLNTTLERDIKASQASLERIHARMDTLVNLTNNDLVGAVIKAQTALDKALQRQEYMQQDVRQILLTVDKEQQEEK